MGKKKALHDLKGPFNGNSCECAFKNKARPPPFGDSRDNNKRRPRSRFGET
jgi:hypothetical protein